jgi:hypothetical protein
VALDGVGMRGVMNIYIYRLTAENLTKRAKGIYKNVSNVQNLNEIYSNSNEFYSEPNSRSHINTRINASRHECNNQL